MPPYGSIELHHVSSKRPIEQALSKWNTADLPLPDPNMSPVKLGHLELLGHLS